MALLLLLIIWPYKKFKFKFSKAGISDGGCIVPETGAVSAAGGVLRPFPAQEVQRHSQRGAALPPDYLCHPGAYHLHDQPAVGDAEAGGCAIYAGQHRVQCQGGPAGGCAGVFVPVFQCPAPPSHTEFCQNAWSRRRGQCLSCQPF